MTDHKQPPRYPLSGDEVPPHHDEGIVSNEQSRQAWQLVDVTERQRDRLVFFRVLRRWLDSPEKTFGRAAGKLVVTDVDERSGVITYDATDEPNREPG